MRPRSLIVLVGLALLLAGCNKGDAADTAAPPPKPGSTVEKAEGKGNLGAEPISKGAGDQTIK